MSTDERLLPIAEAIAEGRAVDWDAIPRDVDPALVRQMREIAGLAGRLDETSRLAAASLSAPVEAPARFAHLTIESALGHGSNGTVYRAYDAVLERHVALKLCAPQHARKEQMLREARLIAQLDHPNVLKVHGAAEHDGLVGFWAELIDGEPMTRWAEQHPRLSARELCAIAAELAAALAAIHALGVVHGDLKPANVVRHRDGRWIVLDFGSSTPLSGRFESGTPAYAAPELLSGGPPARSTDLYSLAAVLFRLASGRLPVEADTFQELKERSARGERLHLIDLRPDLPPRFAGEIERALSQHPDERPVSAGAFAEALAAALRPAEAAPRGRGPLLGVLGAALLALLAFVIFGRGPGGPAPAPPAIQVSFEKSSASGPVALRDGDRIAPGDALSLSYRNTAPAHVYVLNEDDTGNVFKLFPLAGAELANPLPAGAAMRLPGRVAGEDQDWRVTSRGGHERFFVVVAEGAVPALESLQIAESRSGLPVLGGDLIAQNDPVRGVGGLAARPEALGGTRMGTWLDELRKRVAGLEVQRVELINQ